MLPSQLSTCCCSESLIPPARLSANISISTVSQMTLAVMHSSSFVLGTVVADIAKSRAEIESARLLVLSAALQVIYMVYQPASHLSNSI